MKNLRLRSVAALAFGLMLTLSGLSCAADYIIDPVHSHVGFSIRHLVSQVHGQFDQFEGTFSYDPAKPEASKAEATIQTTSVNTNNDKRDTHLKSADFFNTAKFPVMTFTGRQVLPGATKENFQLEGTLTLLGISKPVVLRVTFGGIAKDPWGGTRAGFEATTMINRKDFGMNWNKALDNGGFLIGDEVKIDIAVEGMQKK